MAPVLTVDSGAVALVWNERIVALSLAIGLGGNGLHRVSSLGLLLAEGVGIV